MSWRREDDDDDDHKDDDYHNDDHHGYQDDNDDTGVIIPAQIETINLSRSPSLSVLVMVAGSHSLWEVDQYSTRSPPRSGIGGVVVVYGRHHGRSNRLRHPSAP